MEGRTGKIRSKRTGTAADEHSWHCLGDIWLLCRYSGTHWQEGGKRKAKENGRSIDRRARSVGKRTPSPFLCFLATE